MMSNKDYTLPLDEKEINLLMKALGQMPFEEVYELIEKIMKNHKDYILHLNEKEIKIVLKALGRRPFEEVYQLIEKTVMLVNKQQEPLLSTQKQKQKKAR